MPAGPSGLVRCLGAALGARETLTFAIPMGKFARMVENMDESFSSPPRGTRQNRM